MRTVLLAWVAGVWWLQQASTLPEGTWFGVMAGVAGGVFAACAIWAVARMGGGRAGGASTVPGGAHSLDFSRADDRWRDRCAVAIFALCAGVFGYSWAALRADARMGDRLPVELEDRDVTVSGVVSGLPVSTGDGLRFAFDVEGAYLPHAGCELPALGAIQPTFGIRDHRRDANVDVGEGASTGAGVGAHAGGRCGCGGACEGRCRRCRRRGRCRCQRWGRRACGCRCRCWCWGKCQCHGVQTSARAEAH